MHATQNVETKDPRIMQFESSMCAEASTLDFGVGYWPDTFRTSDGHDFERMKEEYEQGELIAVKYVDKLTKGVLTVFND